MSQAGELNVVNNHPEIPTTFVANVGSATPALNTLDIFGSTQAAGSIPVETTGSGNTITTVVQTSQAIAATDATKIGLAAFDSASFTVDANGFVTLSTPAGTEEFAMQTGISPVTPIAGIVTFNGAVVAAGTNPVRTDGTAAHTMTLEVQKSQASAVTDATRIGLACFNNAEFTVDANGFVSLVGNAAAIEKINLDTGTSPIVPSGGIITLTAGTVAAGTNPIRTDGTGANTAKIEAQFSQAIAATDATKVGLSNFDSAAFDVDANGFVQLNGGGIALTSVTVDANTAPGTNPVVPTASGAMTIEAAAVAAHSVPIETRSRAVNTFKVEVQEAAAVAATDATKSGIAHFDSARFTVDANGFVSINGSGVGETITGQSGGALSPTAGNWNISGASTAAGTSPVVTSGAVSTLTVNVQKSQAIAATDATKIGLAAFDSADFTVDANGFVSATTTGFIKTLTGNSGGAIAPVANNINTLGTGSITIAGAGSTLTTQLTGLTNHAVLVGAGTATITNIAATANTGAVLQNNSGADPSYSTATYPSTTTVSQILYSSATNTVSGLATANRGVLTTGATGVPVITALATDGQLIIGSTAGVPAAATLSAGTGITITNASNSITIAVNGSVVGETITGDSGGALSPSSGNWNILGRSGSKTSGSGSTLTIKSPAYADAGGSATSTLNSGSFVTGAFTLTLPASAGLADGDLFEYVATSAAVYVIQAVGAQKIRIGNTLSSAAGTATSDGLAGTAVALRFRASDGFFYAISTIGVFTLG